MPSEASIMRGLPLGAGRTVPPTYPSALLSTGAAGPSSAAAVSGAGPSRLFSPTVTTPSSESLSTLAVAESANEMLALRVAAREAELKHSYEQLGKLERAHAATEERHRILQDMHDGVGSQLLSTLMMAQNTDLPQKTLVTLLQECLDDMRLVIDSLTPDDRDLLPVLGNFRFRMEARFRALGLQFEWDNHDMPDALEIDPGVGLNVLRILQEALANVLKHAQARRVNIDIFYQNDALLLRVRDDGRGIDESTAEGNGRGVKNMHSRAQRIGASLNIARQQRGTEVTLHVMLSATCS